MSTHHNTKRLFNDIIHNINFYDRKGDSEMAEKERESLDLETTKVFHRNKDKSIQNSCNYYRKKGGLDKLKVTALF
jgi:hypothetical protein